MFEQLSYVGYTALFCIPPLILIWLRREFFAILVRRVRVILLATGILTLYGCLIWPIALKYGAWSYGSDRITNVKLFDFVYFDDLFWWLLVSLLFSSFVSLSTHYEKQGVNIVWSEIKGLALSFRNAFRGFRVIPLERNSTIHLAIATFVLLEAVLLRISRVEWMFVAITIGCVVGFELFNSGIERLASRREENPAADLGLIKDAAAAGVLIAAAAAAAIGLLIFLRRILPFLR